MNERVPGGRIAILAGLLLIILSIYFVFLYKLQIVEGEEYSQQSANSIASIQTVEAARGNILDRYGRTLVTNSQSYNIILNETELFGEDDPNAAILELVNYCRNAGQEYTDTLPITTEPPFTYTEMTESQETALKAYLQDKELDENTSAVELLSYMRSRYEIDNNYSAEDMRTIAGIRYEINVRYAPNAGVNTYIFVEDADKDLIASMLENDVPGISIQTTYQRTYNTKSAAHILGYIGQMNAEEYATYKSDNYSMNAKVGKDGAEKAFESYLHGTDGLATITKTQEGTVTQTVYTTSPSPGNNVYLTIDLRLQEATEEALQEGIEDLIEENAANAAAKGITISDENGNRITGGAAVVVDVDTGEPLAMASYPTYDLTALKKNFQKLSEEKDAPLFNRTTLGTYAPGSTFKPCTAIAALSEGLIDLNTTIVCNGIFTKYEAEGYAPVCWIWSGYKLTHGGENVITAIRDSCNIFFYTLGDYLGIEKLDKYAWALGLGNTSGTGIELPEDTGNMANKETHAELYKGTDSESWYAGDNVQAAIGQSDSLFTPLQLAEYCATIANGGTRHTASLLKTVRSYDSTSTVYQRQAEVMDTIQTAEENWDAIQQGMYLVANDPSGSAYEAFEGYWLSVAAKTGTAQTGSGSNNGCFICYAPYDDPQIAIAIVVEHAGAGASIAPIAREILDQYFASQETSNVPDEEKTVLK